MPDQDDTVPQTPIAKRLSIPDFDPGETRDDLVRALSNAIVSIADNLQFLRLEAEARAAEETVNTKAIRMLTARVAKIEAIVLTQPPPPAGSMP